MINDFEHIKCLLTVTFLDIMYWIKVPLLCMLIMNVRTEGPEVDIPLVVDLTRQLYDTQFVFYYLPFFFFFFTDLLLHCWLFIQKRG